MRNIKRILILFFLTIYFTGLFSQEIKIRPDGDTIVVYPDGSWKAFEASDKVILDIKKKEKSGPIIITNTKPIVDTLKMDTSQQQNRPIPSSTSGFLTRNARVSFIKHENLTNFPPSKPCEFKIDAVDPISGEKRRLLFQEEITSFTSPQFKNYFKDSDQIRIFAEMSSLSGGFRFLRLEVQVKSQSAVGDYGNFKVRSPLSFLNVNGDALNFVVVEIESPRFDQDKELFIFNAQFQISNKQMKLLEKYPVDKMRIVWNTGFEEYEVYNVDYFQRQLDCLN